MSEESLYADWKKLYPRHQTGFFRNLRWMATWVLLGIFFILPLLRWHRPGDQPDQAILFDLPARKFYLFDLIVWPQDIFLLAFLLMAMALGLFFITALAGRVFCGYFCFQTVWTDLFLYVERLVEGNRKQRIKLDGSGWTTHKIIKKSIKHSLWMLIGVVTGGFFVSYFVDAPTLFFGFLKGEAPFAAWFTLFFVALCTYVFAGFAREQVCIFMCPYARFQGAMFDNDTIIVAYMDSIGEPRKGNRRIREALKEEGKPVGACIDCFECVTVCPTGIDIRKGQQYECITCAACIDACDSVEKRLNVKHSLIRYTSLSTLNGGKPHFFRPRILVYAGLLVVLFLGIIGYFVVRPSLGINVIPHRQPVFIRLSDGSIQNNYTIRILNISHQTQTYSLDVEGLKDAHMTVGAITEKSKTNKPLLRVKSGIVIPYTVYLRQPYQSLGKGRADITFKLKALDLEGGEDAYETIFVRPK